jgi:hypothetical protein
VLKIAAWKRPPSRAHDLAVVERFLPAAAVSMRNARVNRSLEMQAVESEVKASLVTLSHAVAHDVNNAVGSILPLAQQMRFELRHGEELDLDTFDRDLGVIIDNARLCQRIFSNMLRVAGAGRAAEGPVDVAAGGGRDHALPAVAGGAARHRHRARPRSRPAAGARRPPGSAAHRAQPGAQLAAGHVERRSEPGRRCRPRWRSAPPAALPASKPAGRRPTTAGGY